MVSRTITVAEELDCFVEEQVRSGQYKDASELVNEALRMKQDQQRKAKQLRAEIQKGLDSGDYPGDPFEEIFAELNAGGSLA